MCFWKSLLLKQIAFVGRLIKNLERSVHPCYCEILIRREVYFFGGWGGTEVWSQVKHVCYHLSHTFSPFCSGYFGDGVLGLFAWAGLKPQSSWPQPPKWLGLQAWTTSTWRKATVFEQNMPERPGSNRKSRVRVRGAVTRPLEHWSQHDISTYRQGQAAVGWPQMAQNTAASPLPTCL
jgi:hypothetical protein